MFHISIDIHPRSRPMESITTQPVAGEEVVNADNTKEAHLLQPDFCPQTMNKGQKRMDRYQMCNVLYLQHLREAESLVSKDGQIIYIT